MKWNYCRAKHISQNSEITTYYIVLSSSTSDASVNMLLDAPIVSAKGDIVDFSDGASLFIVIEFAQLACQPGKEIRHMLYCHLCAL